ncbi:MAG: diacylglycerol kinase family lipid kinase [Bacteroidetes bacterium]|nr:diacylglycerol kinase family lipid kinase [Bacteroidota bacterium]
MKKKLMFIVNPHSGGKKHEQLTKSVERLIDANRFDTQIVYTQYARHASEISRQAVTDGIDVLVAVGGDGTINEVASEIVNTNVVLGIVPMGSGNGLARHLGIPRQIDKAIALINQSVHTKIDTCTVNGQRFVSIAGVGFDALVAKFFAKSERRGFLGYFTIVANKYLSYRPKKYKLRFANGDTLQTRALFIAFANSNQFGYNTTIAPEARISDGLLDVCIVKKPLLVSLPVIANLLLLKKINLANEVQITQTPEVTVIQSRNRVVNMDGEPVRIAKKLYIKIDPLSLHILINKEDGKI